jgi:hypothetical protein
MEVNYTRIYNPERWGVKVFATTPPTAGSKITVITKDGKAKEETIAAVVRTEQNKDGQTYHICDTEKGMKNHESHASRDTLEQRVEALIRWATTQGYAEEQPKQRAALRPIVHAESTPASSVPPAENSALRPAAETADEGDVPF